MPMIRATTIRLTIVSWKTACGKNDLPCFFWKAYSRS
jgi:hypothetical protein